MKIIILSTILVALLIGPGQILAQKNYLIIDGKKYELAPGPSYYDAHPEERARDAAAQANKPIENIRTREQGYGGGSYRDYSSPSSPPPPPPVPSTPGVLIRVPGGAIGTGTGDFYPKSGHGLIDPKTGGFLPDVGGGYIDPSTGTFIPKK